VIADEDLPGACREFVSNAPRVMTSLVTPLERRILELGGRLDYRGWPSFMDKGECDDEDVAEYEIDEGISMSP